MEREEGNVRVVGMLPRASCVGSKAGSVVIDNSSIL